MELELDDEKLIDEIQGQKLRERTRRADLATEAAALDNIIDGVTGAGRSIYMRSTMQFSMPNQNKIKSLIESNEPDYTPVEYEYLQQR